MPAELLSTDQLAAGPWGLHPLSQRFVTKSCEVGGATVCGQRPGNRVSHFMSPSPSLTLDSGPPEPVFVTITHYEL